MDLEREQRIRTKAFQIFEETRNPDEVYNWYKAMEAVDEEDRNADDNITAQLEAAQKSGDAYASIVLKSGREIPAALFDGGKMLSVSHKSIMRLLLSNQASLSSVFDSYCGADEEITYEQTERFAAEFDLIPALMNPAQLLEVFTLVNTSEAADDDTDSCDVEEFTELVVRLGVLYGPSTVPLTRDEGVMEAVRNLFVHLNNTGRASFNITSKPSFRK